MIMRFTRSITVFFIFLVCIGKAICQGYDIKVTINGLSNTDLLLAYHYGSKVYVIDTVKTNQDSHARFIGEEPLEGGMYLIYLPDKRYFDFLISEDQKIQFITDSSDLIGNMKIKGSKENLVFFDFQTYLSQKSQQQDELRASLKEDNFLDKQKDSINMLLIQLNKEVEVYWDNLIIKNKGTFVGSFLKGNREIVVPPAKSELQKNDQFYTYNYLIEHFFDNVDLGDPRLLRTTVISSKLERYFDRTIIQNSDSLISRALWLIEKCRSANKDVFRYVTHDLLNRYAQPEIMGHDAIYVKIAEKYYLSGLAGWISNEDLKMVENRVNMIKPNLIGNLAPELILEDLEGNKISLHEFNVRFTILFFWDHECGHCKETVKVLQQVLNKYSFLGVGIFAVYTMDNIESWKDFVNENVPGWTHAYDSKKISNFRNLYDAWGNPTVYILDKNKKIIAKKFQIQQLEELLDRIIKNSTSSE